MRATCLALLGISLLGAGPARAVTVAQVAKLVGDCSKHCGGPLGTGESQPGAFGQAVALSRDGSTALIGTPLADPELPLEVLRTIHSFDPCMACACHTFDATGRQIAKVKIL